MLRNTGLSYAGQAYAMLIGILILPFYLGHLGADSAGARSTTGSDAQAVSSAPPIHTRVIHAMAPSVPCVAWLQAQRDTRLPRGGTDV